MKPEEKEKPKKKEYSAIRRMLSALDRFLTKRFMFVIAFCASIISACVVGLSTGSVSASSGGGTPSSNLTLQVWLWSIIAVCVFVAVVTSVYVLGRKKTLKQKS